ncbi:flagellin lysine-N-methylase [Viridibacillus arvi]|uniref:flagellin lysine-N-methylase n=1 Tax=Viridibacillus arvi TaxID=263475 RepID=UPI003D072852
MNRKALFPAYMNEFSCIGSACEDTCCAGWNVTIDQETYKKYKKLPNSTIKKELDSSVKRVRSNQNFSNYGKMKLNSEGACNLLDNNALCKIHSQLGEDYLCNTCSVYPRILNQVDDIVEKSLTLSCPEAARLALLKPGGIDFIEEEESDQIKGFIMKKISSNEEYPYFWKLRMYTIQILQEQSHKIEVRLMTLGLFYRKLQSISEAEWELKLEEIMTHYYKQLLSGEMASSFDKLEHNIAFQMNLAKELINYRFSNNITSKRYIECLQEVFGALKLEEGDMDVSIECYIQAFKEYYEPFISKHEYILENYTVNYVFKNFFPYDQTNLFESFVMLIVNVMMIKLHLIGMAGAHDGLSKDLVVKLVQSYSKTIDHNSNYLTNVRTALKDSGYTTMAHMLVLLKV